MKSKKRDDLYSYAYLNHQDKMTPLFGVNATTQRELDNILSEMTTDYFVSAHMIPWAKADSIKLPFEKLSAYSQLDFNRDLYDERTLVYSLLAD